MSEQANKALMRCLQVGVSAVVLAVVLWQLEMGRLRAVLGDLSIPMMAVVCILLVPSLGIRAYRWRYLFNTASCRLSMSESVALLLVGVGLNLALPASTGDVAKSYFGYKWSGVKERMLAISVMDKIIALSSVAVLGLPFSLWSGDALYGGLAVVILLPGAALVALPWVLSVSERWRERLERLSRRLGGRFDVVRFLEASRISGRSLMVAGLWSIGGWLFTYLQLFFCLMAVGGQVRVGTVLSAAPFLTLVRLFPLTLNGLGTDEAAQGFVFQQAGLTLEVIIAGALLYRLVTLIVPGLVGLVVLTKMNHLGTPGETISSNESTASTSNAPSPGDD